MKKHIGNVTCSCDNGVITVDLTIDYTGVDIESAYEIMSHASSIRVRLFNSIWKKLPKAEYLAMNGKSITFPAVSLTSKFSRMDKRGQMSALFEGHTSSNEAKLARLAELGL